jgi:RNA polymerase subunit RPABC4/transcription elongation factor Spt4
MKNVFTVLLDNLQIKAKRAIVYEDCKAMPGSWICPNCKDCMAPAEPICDYIQYGFEWDHMITVLQCQSCGQHFFSDYDLWHTKRRKKRNA